MNYAEWKQKYLECFLILTKEHLGLENYSDDFCSDIANKANKLLGYGCFNDENLGFWKNTSPELVAKGNFSLSIWVKNYFTD